MAQGSDAVHEVFLKFASYGTRTPETLLDGAKFAKLCKDCGLLNKQLINTDVDLIFTQVKAKGARKITYEQFLEALEKVATKKGLTAEELKAAIAESEGPKSQATKADFVKFHDDKSLYTGVYANGGPTNVDGEKGLKDLCDRSAADVRGVSSTFTKG